MLSTKRKIQLDFNITVFKTNFLLYSLENASTLDEVTGIEGAAVAVAGADGPVVATAGADVAAVAIAAADESY